jgi:3-phenylpropionate/cinnamic acid dioxygenase small subunit
MISAAVIREVEQFLYREARLLDERHFRDWLNLFTEDVRYWMVMRSNRYPRGSKALSNLAPARFADPDADQDNELAVLDETKASLAGRIDRFDTGMAWAEDPPSRTRHMVTNIEVEAGDTNNELKVYANVVVYRSRGESEQDFFVGGRQDLLRRVGGALMIARRRIVLDQNVLSAKNISIFF